VESDSTTTSIQPEEVVSPSPSPEQSRHRHRHHTGTHRREPEPRKTSQRHQSSREEEESEQTAHLRATIASLKVDLSTTASSHLDFASIAGLETVKTALEEFALFFLHFPHLTSPLPQRSTTGILLFGPQGTGKTLLIRCFAKKFNMALYDVRASAIMSKFVGEAEKFVKELFRAVRADAPAVLMLDECEGLLCDPAKDAMQSHNYRLLQNELKNQWSDLMYSRDEVVVVGATNKPGDVDMDGFGRRLAVKLHVDLPTALACKSILKGSLGRLRTALCDEEEWEVLGLLCAERGLSGYDIDCLVEGMLRKATRGITLATWFKTVNWDGCDIAVPCTEEEEGAVEGPWANWDIEKVSYRPFTFGEVEAAIRRARPTVDQAMRQKHHEFAGRYASED
jgi:vacuolar protein-sorting-associated protein 4